MTAGRELFEKTTGRLDQFHELSAVTQKSWEMRAVGDHSFIPSEHHDENQRLHTVAARPDPEIPVQLIEFGDPRIPGGAKAVANKAKKNGWSVLLSYCRGPWNSKAETTEDGEGNEEVMKYAQADSVLIRGRRVVDGQVQKIAVMYLRKPWTKVGQKPDTRAGAGGYQAEIRQVRPTPHGKSAGIVSSDELTALIESSSAWRTNA